MKLLYPGMKAHTSDGVVIPVVDVFADSASGEGRYLVLSANGFFGPDVVVPCSVIGHIDHDLYVTVSAHELASYPHYSDVSRRHDDTIYSKAKNRGKGWYHERAPHSTHYM